MFRRARAALAALALILGSGLLTGPAQSTAATPPAPITITGLDLHDGAIAESGGLYILVGTEYGCGFQWGQPNTPWCGFGYSTATSPAGPWSSPQLLFSPVSADPWTGASWNAECGATGAGCFNARLVRRAGWGADDGVWLLLFNSPADYARNGANAYNIMGCDLAGTAIGCGPGETVGAHGSYVKPPLDYCYGNGDVGVAVGGGSLTMLCTTGGTLSEEQLNKWGTGTAGTGSSHLAGLINVEAPGAWQDPITGTWLISFSDPNCGYCAGTGTGYATATSLLGPWTAPTNLGWSAPGTGRRDLSPNSCGGQPRTVSILDGQPYEGIDLWTGSANETNAGLHYEPLDYNPAVYGTGAAGDGQLFRPPFAPWTCQ